MKRLALVLAICALMIEACGSSESAIQTALAETQIVIPTATFTPQPTDTPLPTATQDYNQLITLFPDLLANASQGLAGEKVNVLDIQYDSSPIPKTLTIRILPDDVGNGVGEAIGITLNILNATYASHPELFPPSLETLVVREYKTELLEGGSFSVGWSDFLAYNAGKITVNQLELRDSMIVK